MDSDLPMDAPRPRLCHLRKRADFAGYGFNLHAEKGKSGQFIGKVDPGSPAELAGLREGDRIVEVNGVNVGSENHQQVVQRIKTVADETKFLVVDAAADEFYRERKIVIRGDMSNVHLIETPPVVHGSVSNEADLKHRPRLCHLKIWPEFTGYGFNLHAEKGKSVQYIGKVDANSPAAAAGLREHDRIVEVNGFNVSADSHQDVVKRIKSDPKQVTLLVVDQEADAYFQKEGIVPSGHLPSVERIECPDLKPDHGIAERRGVVYKPRLCHIKSRGDGKGFGFNMQAEKGKSGQYIGKIDPDSPAEEAGLRDGDRLIEVNGVNVESESHKHVVTRIKSIPNETTLLVIEKDGYEYYTAKGIVVTCALLDHGDSDRDHKHRSSEVENGNADDRSTGDEGTHSQRRDSSYDGDDDNREIDDVAEEITNIAKDAEKEEVFAKTDEKKPEKAALSLDVTAASVSVSSTSSTPTPLESPKSPVVIGGIEFAGTAEEARKKMSKKRNAKGSNMSAKAKYDLFQKL